MPAHPTGLYLEVCRSALESAPDSCGEHRSLQPAAKDEKHSCPPKGAIGHNHILWFVGLVRCPLIIEAKLHQRQIVFERVDEGIEPWIGSIHSGPC
jgi:hypothetical protein